MATSPSDGLKKVSNEAAQPACSSRSAPCDWKVMMEQMTGRLKPRFCFWEPRLSCRYMSELSFFVLFSLLAVE